MRGNFLWIKNCQVHLPLYCRKVSFHQCGKDRHILCAINYCIVANFWGRKPSQILQFYSHLWKVSPRNFRHATPIYAICLTFHKIFLREMLPSYQSTKVFSLESFPLYSTGQKNIVINESRWQTFSPVKNFHVYGINYCWLIIVIAAILAQGGIWNGCYIFKGNSVSFTSDCVSFDLYLNYLVLVVVCACTTHQ